MTDQRPIQITLVTTGSTDQPNSMSVYADLVGEVLGLYPDQVQVTRLDLFSLIPHWPGVSPRVQQRLNQLWLLAIAPWLLKKYQADIFHLVDGSYCYVLRQMPVHKCVVTVHDLIPALQCNNHFPVSPPGIFARWLINHNLSSLKRQKNILVDSSCTAKDVKQLTQIDKDCPIIFPALRNNLFDSRPQKIPSWIDREIHGTRLIFHIGNNGFYKNRLTVVKVFAKLEYHHPLRLIMAGAPPDDEMLEQVHQLNVGQRVEFIPYPDDEKLVSLYCQASILLFPSYYEGFGWPPLEAMVFGCAVVCSNGGSLPEIVGDAGLTAAPDDIMGLASQCQSLLDNPSIARRQIHRGFENIKRFDKNHMAKNLLDLYQTVV